MRVTKVELASAPEGLNSETQTNRKTQRMHKRGRRVRQDIIEKVEVNNITAAVLKTLGKK